MPMPALSFHPTLSLSLLVLSVYSLQLNSRIWETYSHSVGVDASCGAAGILLRLLAIPLPKGVRQERIKQDLTLQSKGTDELLNPSHLPLCMQRLVVSK